MADQSRRGAATVAVRQQAARIALGVNVADARQVWRAIRSWLATHTRFVPDPDTVELVRTPPEQLRLQRAQGTAPGDCDDTATLAAALALALGQRVHFVVLGFFAPDAPFVHVYAEQSLGDDTWGDFDVTRTPGGPVPSRVAVFGV